MVAEVGGGGITIGSEFCWKIIFCMKKQIWGKIKGLRQIVCLLSYVLYMYENDRPVFPGGPVVLDSVNMTIQAGIRATL